MNHVLQLLPLLPCIIASQLSIDDAETLSTHVGIVDTCWQGADRHYWHACFML